MKAFISYSHNDEHMLVTLHKHLAQLKRDGIINAWTDEQIPPGGNIGTHVSNALTNSQLFLALLSPDYINSRYCYEKEFQTAIELEKEGGLIIVPIILQPCDWLNTPFNKYKALPKDGKPISNWENENTAFLDVIQNLRYLIQSPKNQNLKTIEVLKGPISRNYRVKKDFDSIEKMEFVEKTFTEVKSLLQRYITEINQLDNIKTRVLNETDKIFECLLVNRNKIDTEANLSLTTEAQDRGFMHSRRGEMALQYSIGKPDQPSLRVFTLDYNDFQMFWSQNNYYSGSDNTNQFSSKEIADTIWKEWLESVGILV